MTLLCFELVEEHDLVRLHSCVVVLEYDIYHCQHELVFARQNSEKTAIHTQIFFTIQLYKINLKFFDTVGGLAGPAGGMDIKFIHGTSR